jgi:hypothetical protein
VSDFDERWGDLSQNQGVGPAGDRFLAVVAQRR